MTTGPSPALPVAELAAAKRPVLTEAAVQTVDIPPKVRPSPLAPGDRPAARF